MINLSRRWRKRLLRHYLPCSIICSLLIALIVWLIESPNLMFQLSIATAYTALLLLVATLITGPINLILNKSNPVSTDLRRDIGIMAALVGISHIVFGLQVHLGNPLYYIIVQPILPNAGQLRRDVFGLANYMGIAATIILILLLLLSNNASLRWLGRDRWKALQRTNYLLFLFVVIHAVLYFVIEERAWLYIGAFILICSTMLIFQGMGVYHHYKKSRTGDNS